MSTIASEARSAKGVDSCVWIYASSGNCALLRDRKMPFTKNPPPSANRKYDKKSAPVDNCHIPKPMNRIPIIRLNLAADFMA